jgi:glycosyltransferase involved in cell wall biosynthesis
MSTQKPFLTIFTPTYNRAHTLERVYRSLKAQSCQDFEWIIVDDGSVDSTEELVNNWIQSATFPIRYFYQQNAGKHIAWNYALGMAKGTYFECLDSDDELSPNAVEVLKMDLKPHIGTVSEVAARAFLLLNPNGELFGKNLELDDFSKSFVELVYENKLPSDVWMAFHLEKLREFPFPEQYKKLYFPEGYVIYAFDKKFSIFFTHNERLGIYHRELGDNLSNSNSVVLAKLKSGSAITLAMIHLGHLNFNIRLFPKYPWKLFIHAIHYNRFRLHTKDWSKFLIREIETNMGRVLAISAFLPGLLAKVIDEFRIRKHRSKYNS